MRRGCGVGWWRITRTLAQASKNEPAPSFHAFADAEVDALAQSKNEDEIEEGREDLKELANKFGCDFDAINMMAVDEQLDGLAAYAAAHEDDWKENYHEERHEAAQDDRFIDDLFDGLADKEEG